MPILPNRALLYRDFKYSKWFIPILFLELLLFFIPNFIIYDQHTAPFIQFMNETDSGLNIFIFIAITITLMVVVLFNYDRKLSNYTFTASMPFTRGEIIKSKWLVGFYNICIPYVSIYVLMNCLLILNFCWQKYFLSVTGWFITSLLISSAVMGFMVMLQSLNGSAIFGGFISTLFAAFPTSIVYLLYGIFHIHYGMFVTPKSLEPITDSGFFMKAFTYVWAMMGISVPTDTAVTMLSFSSTYTADSPFSSYYNVLSITRYFIYIFLIIAFNFLSIKFFKKNQLECNGYITAYKPFEKIYKALMSYFLCFFLLIVFNMVSLGQNPAFRPDIVAFFSILLPIPFYFLMSKVIKVYNKRLN